MGWFGEHVRVQIAIGNTPFAAAPTFVTFDPITVDWGFRRGGGPVGQCSPASAKITVDNSDGRWDPGTGLGGPTWAGNVKRWLQVRIMVSNNNFASSTLRFRGFLTDVVCSTNEHEATATITCTDALGICAEFNLEDLVRPAELPGVRIQAILTAAGIPAGFVGTVDTGIVVLDADTLSGQALQAIQECARAEGGHVWSTYAGFVTFTDRHHFVTAALSGFALTNAEIERMSIPQSLAAFTNYAVGASSGVTGKVMKFGTAPAESPASTRRDMDTNAVWDADASATAQWLQRHGTFAGTRVDQVICSVNHGDDVVVLNGLVAGTLNWLDTVTVSFTPAHGAAVSQLCWVEGESHSVSVDGWTLTLDLSPVSTSYRTQAANFYTYGTTVTSSKIAGY